jgi:hypothetical protein
MAGLITRLLSFVRSSRLNNAKVSESTIDPGGGANRTADHYSAPGDDAHPLPGDYVCVLRTQQQGRTAAVGYLDSVNAGVAAAGDKRIYSRSESGTPVTQVWLRNDGTVLIDNGTGSIAMAASGDVTINGVLISAAGEVTIPASLVLAGKQIAAHTHDQGNDSAGDVQQTTGPNN